MEFGKCNEARHSVRRYTGAGLEKSDIEDILRHGTLAPSGRNRQPWYFVVVEDPALKDRMGDLILEKVPAEGHGTRQVVRQAPAVVVVYDRETRTAGDEKMFDHISIGACMQNMNLRAVDKGLGALWIGFICLAEKEISQLLGVSGKKMVAALAIGHPGEVPHPAPRDGVDQITLWR